VKRVWSQSLGGREKTEEQERANFVKFALRFVNFSEDFVKIIVRFAYPRRNSVQLEFEDGLVAKQSQKKGHSG